MICGYSANLLVPHLKSEHKTTPREYRKQFAIPADIPLDLKAYKAKREKIAKETSISDKPAALAPITPAEQERKLLRLRKA